MAAVHRLTNSAVDAAYTVDFIAGPLKRRAGSWSITHNGDGTVTEVFTVIASGTDAVIIAEVQQLSELMELNRLYWQESTSRKPVWYEASANGESAAKRALVKEIGFVPVTEGMHAAPTLGSSEALYDISITRFEEWEDRSGTAVVSTSGTVSSIGGTVAVSAQSGSYPARITLMQFGTCNAGPLYKVWAGIRPTANGLASFDPVWELSDGSAGTASDSGTAADGALTVMRTTFAGTAAMAQRCLMTVDQATTSANFDHFAGRYLVLNRCRINDATGTVTLQMKSGYGTVLAPGEFKEVSGGTAYKYVPMGEVLIPPTGNYADTWVNTAVFRTFAISIFAERNSAGGTLYMDRLVLIPTDHFTYSVGNSITTNTYTNHYVFEDGKHAALGLDNSATPSPNTNLEVGFRNWECPVGGGVLVIAGERGTAQVTTDTLAVYMNVFHRHRYYND